MAYGEINIGISEVLSRIAVGESLKLINFLKVELDLMKQLPVVSRVKAMGEYKALITFSTVEDMKLALVNNIGILRKQFDEIRSWSTEEFCETLRV